MKIEEKTYSQEDYVNLVMQLLENPDIDATLRTCPRNVHNLNPNFYLMLFKVVEVFRERQVEEGNRNVVALLDQLKSKLYEYTDIIPADLPASILQDKILADRYLDDHRTLVFKDDDWNNFQDYILEKARSIPQNLELPFLNWCVRMLEMNLAKHMKKCTNPLNCRINQGYDRRLQYLARLIEEITPTQIEPVHLSESMRKPTNKIQWLGSQKELAELFIYLRAKGWIVDFEPETIKECFTSSNTIHQYLKPGEYTEDLRGTFEQVFTSEYSPKFNGIKQNIKRG